jgi:signal transduction histidine kinase
MTLESDRGLAGRLVIAALAETDRADAAELRAVRFAYLTDLERRLGASLHEVQMRETVAGIFLPQLNTWVVVDLVEPDGTVVRLAAPEGRADVGIVGALKARWQPAEGMIGYPAVSGDGRTVSSMQDVRAAFGATARMAEDLALIEDLGFVACLTVAIRTADAVDGALTFVTPQRREPHSPEEIAFAEQVASACGRALRNAREFGVADRGRQMAEMADREKTDMLGLVTHELRTPLSAIGGYAELIQLGVRGPVTEGQHRDLERIRWNQRHLLSLITQILSFVRVDTGRTEYTITDVDLGPAAQATSEMIEPLIAAKAQVVEYEACGAGIAIARADGDKVRQIMINLITNAIKYSPDESHVIVRCGVESALAFCEVTDRGTGIAAEELESIFRPFVQLTSGVASRGGGVGLGLSIARQLARGMRGDLTAASTPGVGSTFRLTLPLAATADDPTAETRT